MTESQWDYVVRPALPHLVKILRPSQVVVGLLAARLPTRDDVQRLERLNLETGALCLLIHILPKRVRMRTSKILYKKDTRAGIHSRFVVTEVRKPKW